MTKHAETTHHHKVKNSKRKPIIILLTMLIILSGLGIIFLGGYLKDKVESGDSVSVDYTGKLEDGKVFDTSIKDDAIKAGITLRPYYEPLTFTAGRGEMIKGFDNAVIGMKIGDEKTVTLKPAEAYGESNPNAIITITVEEFKKAVGNDPIIGYVVTSKSGAVGKITSIKNNNVVIDFNHELAGKTLIFSIKLVALNKTKS